MPAPARRTRAISLVVALAVLVPSLSGCSLVGDDEPSPSFVARLNGKVWTAKARAYVPSRSDSTTEVLVVEGTQYASEKTSAGQQKSYIGPRPLAKITIFINEFDGEGRYVIGAGDGRYAEFVGGDVVGLYAKTQTDNSGWVEVDAYDPETGEVSGNVAFDAVPEAGGTTYTVRDGSFTTTIR